MFDSTSQLTLADISDNDSYAEGMGDEDFDSELDGKTPVPSRKSSKRDIAKKVLDKQQPSLTISEPFPLEFVAHHFKKEDYDSGSIGDTSTPNLKSKSTTKIPKKQLTLEDELAEGLEFDFYDNDGEEVREEKNMSANNNTESSTQSQAMGNLLAGALSAGAHTMQDTVANIVASQMVSSIMQNTVAGFSRIGESVGLTTRGAQHPANDAAQPEKGSMEEQSISKENDGGKAIQDSGDFAEDFEFLNEEDFDNQSGQSENSHL